jgi:hypothetical protein
VGMLLFNIFKKKPAALFYPTHCVKSSSLSWNYHPARYHSGNLRLPAPEPASHSQVPRDFVPRILPDLASEWVKISRIRGT